MTNSDMNSSEQEIGIIGVFIKHLEAVGYAPRTTGCWLLDGLQGTRCVPSKYKFFCIENFQVIKIFESFLF